RTGNDDDASLQPEIHVSPFNAWPCRAIGRIGHFRARVPSILKSAPLRAQTKEDVNPLFQDAHPAPVLARLVDNVRMSVALPAMRVERFPDGPASLLLRNLGNGRGDLSIVGPRTRALFKVAPPADLIILIQFKPGGALPFFGVPLSAFTDRFVL